MVNTSSFLNSQLFRITNPVNTKSLNSFRSICTTNDLGESNNLIDITGSVKIPDLVSYDYIKVVLSNFKQILNLILET